MQKRLTHLALGTMFGFLLARTGAADFDAMDRMFLFRSFHLFGLAIVTTLGAALGLALLRRASDQGKFATHVRWSARPLHRGSIWGALLFGIGWAVSGACPGTALVQLGEGHLVALSTVVGIVVGAALQSLVNRRFLHWPRQSCE